MAAFIVGPGTQINQSQLIYQTVHADKLPPEREGERAVNVVMNFAGLPGTTNAFSLNLQNIQQRDFISKIQGMFIDNGANASILYIWFPVSGQILWIPANSQAYLQVLCVNPPQIFFISNTAVVVSVQLLNFPVSNCVWSV